LGSFAASPTAHAWESDEHKVQEIFDAAGRPRMMAKPWLFLNVILFLAVVLRGSKVSVTKLGQGLVVSGALGIIVQLITLLIMKTEIAGIEVPRQAFDILSKHGVSQLSCNFSFSLLSWLSVVLYVVALIGGVAVLITRGKRKDQTSTAAAEADPQAEG